VLVARAQEQTWLVVKADGGEAREVLLQAGQTARFTAAKSFLLTVGNAGGVTLTVDGVAVAPLGRSGQVVRDLTLPQPGGAGSTAGAPAEGSGR
jgi:cytoskeleton protein RodZ